MSVIFTIYAIMSVLTLVAFAFDKQAARRWPGRRIPESTLHVMEFMGGFPGAIAGQQLFRHKSSKRRYIAVLWCIVLLHGLGWAYWFWLR